MTKKNSTKSRLIASILVLCLCLTSLIGTTFAWFTDEVTSSGNKIVSGSLKVDLELLDKTSGKWSSVKEKKDPIFTYENWEPGYVDAKILKVDNEGTLALKWKAKFASASALTELADVIDVYVLPYGVLSANDAESKVAYPAGRDLVAEGYTRVGTLAEFVNTIESTTYGELLKGESAYLGIALKMQESAGNKYQDMDLGGEFDIQIVATQLASENDSFGPDYDAGAEYDGEITNAVGFKAALAAGGSYKLMNNVTVDGAEIPEGATVSIELDGNNINLTAPIVNNGTLVINGTAVATAWSLRAAATNSIEAAEYAIENKGDLVVNGGTFSGLGCIRSTGGKVTINGGDFYASSDWNQGTYQHVLKAVNTVVEINGGNFDATVNGQTNAMINVSENSTVTVNGGNFKNVDGELPVFAPYIFTYEKNGKLIINDGTFYGGWRFNGEAATTDIYGGNFTVGFDGQSFNASSTHVLTVHGGAFASQTNAKLTDKLTEENAGVLAEGFSAVKANGAYVVLPGENVATNSQQLRDLINGGATRILLAAGDYVMPDSWTGEHDTYVQNNYNDGLDGISLKGKELTLVGVDGTVLDCSGIDSRDQIVTGATLAFENLTANFGKVNYMGFMNTKSISYTGCEINGLQFFGTTESVSFVDCDLNSNGAEHSVWTWSGDKSLSFEGCDFTYADRAVNCYGENGTANVSFTDCTFTKVAGAQTTGAIETNSSTLTKLNLTIDGCTVNEGYLWWVSSYDSKGGANTYAVVDGKLSVGGAGQFRAVAAAATGSVVVDLICDVTLGNETTQKEQGVFFPNATDVTIVGNGNTVTFKGPMTGNDWHPEYYAAIVAPNAKVTVKDVTLVNEKLSNEGGLTSADREAVYTMVRGTETVFEDVEFIGGVQAKNNTRFVNCTFVESVLTTNEAGYATDGRFCVFIDHEYTTEGEYEFTFEGCTFNASGYGCVKVAGDDGAKITVNVKDCTFNNTCPRNKWSTDTPKWDVKLTGDNITANDLGENDWSDGTNAGMGEG